MHSPDGGYEDERCFALKLAFYLDPLDAATGCVRLLPGSHRNNSPWRADNGMELTKALGISPAEVPGQVAVHTQPGDLVCFNHKTFHASFGGGKRRRMFTVGSTQNHAIPTLTLSLTQRRLGVDAVDEHGAQRA